MTMYVSKQESKELVSRQLEFFTKVPSCSLLEAESELLDSYTYNFIPGVSCTYQTSLRFLSKEVWNQEPLKQDNTCLNDYLYYVGTIAENKGLEVRIALDILDDLNSKQPCLVHGDATEENLIFTENAEVVPIDPGMPRGFSLPENDLGKLLQNVLTHWIFIKFKTGSLKNWADVIVNYEVNSYIVASLVTHWVRILKNADRHSKRVERFGTNSVIPTLIESLEERELSGNPRGSRWSNSSFKRCYDKLLSDCFQNRVEQVI